MRYFVVLRVNVFGDGLRFRSVWVEEWYKEADMHHVQELLVQCLLKRLLQCGRVIKNLELVLHHKVGHAHRTLRIIVRCFRSPNPISFAWLNRMHSGETLRHKLSFEVFNLPL